MTLQVFGVVLKFSIMKTLVLMFSVYAYKRDELEKMSSEELFNLAFVASTLGYDEASVLTLEKFSTMANNAEIHLSNVWLYFVSINE